MDDADEIRQWERKAIASLLALLTASFMVWAGVVWNATDKVMVRIDTIVLDMSRDRIEQQQYRAIMERRLTIQEQQTEVLRDRQKWVIDQMHDDGRNGVP